MAPKETVKLIESSRKYRCSLDGIENISSRKYWHTLDQTEISNTQWIREKIFSIESVVTNSIQ